MIRNFVAFILLALAAVSTGQGIRNALEYSDDAQWLPSRMLLLGHDPTQVLVGYPPSGLVFLWPLALLPWDVFKIVLAILNVCFAVGIVYLLWRLYFKSAGPFTFLIVEFPCPAVGFMAGATAGREIRGN